LKVQRIATDQTAGRMYQHVVADGVTFWIQALQQAQRAAVFMAGYGAALLQAVVNRESGVPRHSVH
jgi:hypothetical protein